MALEMNEFHAGDEHYSAGDERVENAIRASATHTHTSSYQQLPSRNYVEMIAIDTATYLRNGRYHVEEVQIVSRCTTCPVALNWSSIKAK